MRLLLDTHALIWWWKNDPLLPSAAREAMIDPEHRVFISAATGWELATKIRKGQLLELQSSLPTFSEDVARDGFHHLDVTARHAVRGGLLHGSHKDPFDRVIAAQALIEDLIVITRDPEIARFGCKVLW
jgi:PIN domain nuclease of toxin-antitoxin system